MNPINKKKHYVATMLFGLLFIPLLSCTSPQTLRSNPLSIEANTHSIRQIPVRDFFKNPKISSYKVSPDGKWLAYRKSFKGRMNIFARKINDPRSKEKQLTFRTDRDIPYFFWKGSQFILFLQDFGGDENHQLFSIDIKSRATNAKRLTPFEGVKVRVIDDLKYVSKNEILISMNKRDKRYFDVYRINIQTGALRVAAKNPGNFVRWMTDHRGRIRVASSTDGVNTSLYYRDGENQKFKKILTTHFRESVNPLFFTFDNQRIYASSNFNRDRSAIVEFDLASGKEVRIVYQHPEVDVDHLSYSKKRKVLIASVFTTWKRQRAFFDKKFETIFNQLTERLPGKEVSIVSSDNKESIIITRTYSDRSLGAYYLYYPLEKRLQKLDDVSPWINENEMAEMKPIQYQSRDGLTIHGYLTLPKGREPKNLPMVVNPHGGPWARDYWGYQSTVQLLANRGYAVLQMNFRGSTGFGKKFWEASFKQWGRKMQDDITDGVHWLIQRGIADRDRVCIYGASYGGYAVLAGLAFIPDLYRCGVDYVGVSNLFTFMKSIPPYWKPYLEMLYEQVGHPEKDRELLRESSPVFHVDKIKAPLLVAQGAKDPRVAKNESDQIVSALRERGIDVPYIVKENEGHGFSNEENRFEFYEAMDRFLAKHLE